MPSVQIESWLARAARAHPARIAVDAPDATLTYAELYLAANRLAARLDIDGDHLMPVERVAVELPASAAFAVAVHACWMNALVVVPIDARLPAAARSSRLAGCIAVLREATVRPFIDLALAEEDAATLAAEIIDWFPSRPGTLTVVHGAVPGYDDMDNAVEGDVVLWTSGSTGAGTERRLTHRQLLWNAIGSAAALGQPPDERWLSSMPVAHVGGFTVLTRSVIGGTTAVLRPRFDVEEQLGILMRGEATITSVVPTMLRRLLDAGLEHPPNLRLVLLGGAPITADLTARAAAAGVPIAPTYGLTETCSQALTNGVPLFCTRVVLRGELPGYDGEAADDELLVRGPTLALGVTDDDGWLETGDRGRREPDGTLTIVGRIAETIITGGENVAPTEVEAELLALPGIADAAVLGVEDPEWGEAIEARIVLEPGAALDEEAVRRALRPVLPPFAVPKRVTVVDVLPRTPTGKLQRRLLR